MYFDHPNRMIFVHNPKTAGRSVIKFLGLDDSEPFRFAHISSATIRKKFIQDDWDDFFSFCFVRNPWERYISLYSFQRSPAYAAMMGNNFSSMIAGRFDLNDWIEFNARSENKSNWFGIDQKRWWSGVSKVYLFENLIAAHTDLSERFELHSPLTHENGSVLRSGTARELLTERSIEIIADIDRLTVEEFGYAPV